MIIEDNTWLLQTIAEAQQAQATGVSAEWRPRMGQADHLLKLDMNFARSWRERIEEAAPELADMPDFIKDFILSFVIARWLEEIEEEVVAIFRGRVRPLVSRPAVELVVLSLVHEHIREHLAGEPDPAIPAENLLAFRL